MPTCQLVPMKRLSELHDVNSDIKRLWTETGADGPEKERGSLIPLSTDNDIIRLKESIDELNTSLENSNKRINRLLGEKKQLISQLDKRDEQIERLYRELGSLSPALDAAARTDRTSQFRGLLTSAFAAVTARIGNFFDERSKADDVPSRSGRSEAATKGHQSRLVARLKSDSGQQVIAVLLFGLAKNELEQLLPVIERDCSSKKMVPLCLIDTDAFELLRRRSLVFEYLPPADDRNRFDSVLNWDLYTQRRLALIRRKWDPVRFVAFGAPATKTLALWSSSPFENTPLPVASSAPPV